MYENPLYGYDLNSRPEGERGSFEEPPLGIPELVEGPGPGWSLSAAPEPTRPAPVSSGLAAREPDGLSVRLIGGGSFFNGRVHVGASWPFVVLRIDDDGLGLGLRGIPPFGPEARCSWSELSDVRLAPNSLSWRDRQNRFYRFVVVMDGPLDSLGEIFRPREVDYKVVGSTWSARFSSSVRPGPARRGAGPGTGEAAVLEPPAAAGDRAAQLASPGPSQTTMVGRDDPSRLLRRAAVLCTHQYRGLFIARFVALSGSVVAAASAAALIFGTGDLALGGAGMVAARFLLAAGSVQLAIGAIGMIRIERKIRGRLRLWRTGPDPFEEAADEVIRIGIGTDGDELARKLRNNT